MKIINKMMSSSQAYRRLLALVGLVTTLILYIPAAAQGTPQSATASVPAATVRTVEEMVQADLAQPTPPPAFIPFRPTMDNSKYAAGKAAAKAAQGAAQRSAPPSTAPLAPPTLRDINCDGVDQGTAGNLFPPDTHGAVGATQFVQIVNSQIVVWDKPPDVGSCPIQLMSASLAAFFGYFNQTLFDPRVLYDPVFNRWVVAAEAFPESATVQLQFVAVSLTSDATGGFFIYNFNARDLSGGGSAFWDFPQIGMDEDAIIVTGNVFNPGFAGARAWFLPKHRMYNGLGFGFCFFSGGAFNLGTIAPPLVRDQNPATVLAIAPDAANFLSITKFAATSRVCPLVLATNNIPVAAYGIPPNAPQPGTAQVLDTSDNRFANTSTQVGNALWQTHTTNDFGVAAPRFYKIDTDMNTIDQTGNFFATATSFDFNPSIVANGSNDVFVTWSVTDVANGTHASVLFGGKQDTDPSISGGFVFTSPTALTGNFDPNFNAQRWGDYSAVTVDPADPTRSWGVNEGVNATGSGWVTRFFNMGIP